MTIMMIPPQANKYKNLYEVLILESKCPDCNETLSISGHNSNLIDKSLSTYAFIKEDELSLIINDTSNIINSGFIYEPVLYCNIYTNKFYTKGNQFIDEARSYIIKQDCENCHSYSKKFYFKIKNGNMFDITLEYQRFSWASNEIIYEIENFYSSNICKLLKHIGPKTTMTRLPIIHFTIDDISKLKRRINELLPYA